MAQQNNEQLLSTPHEFDPNDVIVYFQSLGYSLSLSPHELALREGSSWVRFWHGRGTDDQGREVHIKVATNEKIGLLLENQIAWNRLVIAQGKVDVIGIPEVYTSGKTPQGFHFGTFAYIEGEPLCEKGMLAEQRSTVMSFLPTLIKASHQIMQTEHAFALPRDVANPLAVDVYENLLFLPKRWQTNIKDKGIDIPAVDYLVLYIQNHLADFIPALAHGDFTPWHFIKDANERLWIIDAEDGTFLDPMGFDLVYGLIRCWEEDSQTGKAFLEALKPVYVQNPKLKAAAKLCIAYRLIGGYFDTTLFAGKSREPLDEILELFLFNELF